MIYEKIAYENNLPFHLSFSNIKEESKHCHEELELLLVLRGTTHYQIYHSDYELSTGDLIISDVKDLHQIHDSSADALMLVLHIDTKAFEGLYPNISYMFFVCEECMTGANARDQLLQSKLALLKQSLAKLAVNYIRHKEDLDQLTKGIEVLLGILVRHFQGFFMEDYQYKMNTENLSEVDLQRLCRITRYLLHNYDQKITLTQVSEIEHLNPYYVSHLIKKTLGFNFQNFLNAIRLEYAEKHLVFTSLTLTQISENCGFSSTNYFNKCFSAWYGKTPAKYRKDYHPSGRSYGLPFQQEEAMALLSDYLRLSGTSDQGSDVLGSISLAPRFDLPLAAQPVGRTFAPHLWIDSPEDSLMLGYFKEKLSSLSPAALVLPPSCRLSEPQLSLLESFNLPVKTNLHFCPPQEGETMAAACSQLLSPGNKVLTIPVFGNKKALFTKEGLDTAYYQAYALLKQFTEGSMEIHPSYTLFWQGDRLSVLVLNTHSTALSNLQLSTEFLPEKFYLSSIRYAQTDHCFSAYQRLGCPQRLPAHLVAQINEANSGVRQFSLVHQEQTPSLEFILYPESLLLLTISSVSD